MAVGSGEKGSGERERERKVVGCMCTMLPCQYQHVCRKAA